MSGVNRRLLLMGLAALPAATLAGCASGPAVAPTTISDVNLIATGLKALMPQLGLVTGLSTTAIDTATQAIVDLQSAADAVATADTIAAAQPLVVRIASDVSAVIGALSAVELPDALNRALQAASVLLPIIEAAVGLAAAVGAGIGVMTPARARAALRTVSTPITK